MNAIKSAIYQRLTGGTALTALLAGTTSVYDSLAPQGAAYPYVIFAQQAANSETDDANDRGDWYYQAQAISTVSLSDAWLIAAQIDALLQPAGTAVLTVTGYSNLWQRRTEWLDYIETDPAGKNYFHAGAIYQFRLTKP